MASVDVQALRILSEYPMLVPYPTYKRWEGFIQAQDQEVHVDITTPNYPSLKDVGIRCSPEAFPLLFPLASQAEDSSLLNLLRSMSHAIKSKRLFASDSLDVDKQQLFTFITVLAELDDIESGNIVDLRSEGTITLAHDDSNGARHELTVKFDADYPKSPATIQRIDLPDEAVRGLGGIGNIRQLFEQFCDTVEGLVEFWETIAELESQCWVIDPDVPRRRDIYRRIFLTTDLSISVVFNVLRRGEMPEIKFVGCVTAVEQKRTDFLSRLESEGWDFTSGISSNLKRLLNIEEFPQKPTNSLSQEDPLECLICATGGTELGAPAQKWCDNDRCPSIYHRSCLHRWFESLQTAKQMWDYICGPCPHCKVKIWCPIKDDVPARQ